PLYNQDFEGEKRPAPVKALLSAITESDGLVLCAPEFNHSIPGVLKNALDWASRPAFTSVMAYKPVAIMATSRGALGGARCLEHLRVALDSMLSRVVLAREVTITSTADKIRDGRIKLEADPELIVPDPTKTLNQGAIAPWTGAHGRDYFGRVLQGLGDELGFNLNTPWERLSAKAQKAILNGHATQVHVKYKNRYGRERSYWTDFEGAIPYVERRHGEAESDTSRERFEGFMREVPCPGCDGTRLRPESLAVTVHGRSISEVA